MDQAGAPVENKLTDITRRAIVDIITTKDLHWAGRLEEPEFLSRLYNLTEMPSTDRRLPDAAADIHMHRVKWPGDWNHDWVFYDQRFNLLHAPDEEFLRFLCETLHPVVRPDVTETRELAAAYNQELVADGYTLVEVEHISGRPVFSASRGLVVEIEAIAPITDDKDFSTLAKSVNESIAANQPEAGLDRLHTFVTKFMRVLCERHGVPIGREKPLHSLVGEYVKALRADGNIHSEMTERILKSSISTLEAFNQVRNEQSLAHDNPILNYDESLLIFNHVASSVRFMEALEKRIAPPPPQEPPPQKVEDDDVPF